MNHKIFISYYHKRHQAYKEYLLRMNALYNIFEDRSVNTGDIDENLSDEQIRTIIRDKYLRDSTVTIVLVGEDTKKRKHIDWEIHSSMYDGPVNKKSGILVINLPEIENNYYDAAHGNDEKQLLYPSTSNWVTRTKEEYHSAYPFMPQRIIDNLVRDDVRISVTPWSKIENNRTNLEYLINATFEDRKNCNYDTSQPMRRHNS